MGAVASRRRALRSEAMSSVAAKVRAARAFGEYLSQSHPENRNGADHLLADAYSGHDGSPEMQPAPQNKRRLSLISNGRYEDSLPEEAVSGKPAGEGPQPRVYTISGEPALLPGPEAEAIELAVVKGRQQRERHPRHHSQPLRTSPGGSREDVSRPCQSWAGSRQGSRECPGCAQLAPSPSPQAFGLDQPPLPEAASRRKKLERMYSVDRVSDDIPIRTWFPKENLFSFQTATTTMQAVFRGYAERKRRKRENDSASVIQRNFRKHLRMVGSRRVKAQTFAERRERSFSRSWSDPTPMKADTSHDSRDSSDLQSSHCTLGEAFEDLDWETERGLEAVACDTEGFVPPKVMLISSKVPKAEYIPTILRRDDPSIIPILYDHEHATFEDILEEIEKKLNVYHKGAKIWKMLIFCQGGPGHLYLLKNKVATFAKVEKEEDMIHFWKRLSHLMSKVNPEPNVIHVMGCYVLGNPNGEKLFQNLRTLMTPYRVTFESPLELSAQGASPTPMGLTWKERAFTALLGAAAVSGLTTLILFLVEATNVLLPADTKFGIVFDAGSSHTSLFVYQWLANKENDTGVVSQALACRAKGPGISSYASDPAQAGESLQGCLEEALALIPKAKHQQTPMFLGATGGMRLLSQKNSSQAEDVFAAVSQALSRSPVAFWGAELLAGQDEGALGWITINYVLGLLVQVPQTAPGWEGRPGGSSWPAPGWEGHSGGSSRPQDSVPPVCGQYSFSGEWIQPLEGTLVGALDMGGASTQITFVPGGPILDTTTQATFRLYGTEHSVYTHSYLCFGRDQMLNRLLAGLVQVGCSAGGGRGTLPGGCSEVPPPSPQSSPSLLVRHPCYHSGYRGTLALAPLYGSPCVQAAAPRDLGQNLTVEGTGNPGACVAAIRGLFNFSSCDGRGDCAFDSVYQPPVRGQFYAFSNFYHTFHFLNLTSRPPLATANATIWEFCQRPWKLVGGCGPPAPHLGPSSLGCRLHRAGTPSQAVWPGGWGAPGRRLRGTPPRGASLGGPGGEASWGSWPPGPPGGGELARAGRPAARLLCLGPVHPHTPARGLRVQPGDLGRHRVPRAGRWHRHRLDAGLHAEPDQPDPSRGARPVAGTELWRLGGRSRLFGADPHGHSRGHCGAALAPGLGWLPPGAGRQRPELAGAFLSPDPQGSPCGLWAHGHVAPFCRWGHSGHRGCTVAPTMAFRCRLPSRFPMLHEGWAIATPAALRAV
ncbi:NMDA receptor synaptonuclear signaling and neuronal migration factor isoform X5 [Orcinus orca]|uniref:NMDA receptor synaptonuclear signaling and neuronal migration factor isoform X5 n=1 Tax=Orcinus orca TaxID=9733 RepID=UPI0021112FE3|nr:NMDA receptor synaptonuclear signaling and neuronal migration factor isoform X5 [Orcinus orca]